jgi:hypothetical protein
MWEIPWEMGSEENSKFRSAHPRVSPLFLILNNTQLLQFKNRSRALKNKDREEMKMLMISPLFSAG